MGFREDKANRDRDWREGRAERRSAQAEGKEANLRQIKKANKRKAEQDTFKTAKYVRQAEPEQKTTGKTRVTRGVARNVDIPIVALVSTEIRPTVQRVVYERKDYGIGPRRGTPDVPMRLPWDAPPLGSLMVFNGAKLLMTMPYIVDQSRPVAMERLYQIPRNSKAYVKIHTGIGTLKGGQYVGLKPAPGGSYGGGEAEDGPDWWDLPGDLNDAIGEALKDKFFWWWDDIEDGYGLFGGDY